MLLSNTLTAWSLALPVTLGSMLIKTNIFNTTSTICSTRFASTSVADGSVLPTLTYQSTLSYGPVMLHSTTTPIVTVTPKPVITKTTVCVANTTWIERAPVTGVWNSTTTLFETSTYWHHLTIWETSTVNIYGTSRTTAWIPASTGFVPIKSSKPGLPKAAPGHPHQMRAPIIKGDSDSTSISTRCRKPLASVFPAAVDCTEQVDFSTTETIIATQRWTTTTTLSAVTLWNTTTKYAVITSTSLVLATAGTETATTITESASSASTSSETSATATPTLVARKYREWLSYFDRFNPAEATERASVPTVVEKDETPTPAAAEEQITTTSSPPDSTTTFESTTSSETSSSASSSTTEAKDGIVINVFTTIQTPFTVTATWTGTETATKTSYIHATHTITALAACAKENLLFANHQQKHINGIAPNIKGQQIEHVIPGVKSAYDCCAACVAGDLACAYSLFELEGTQKGRCVLYAVVDSKTDTDQETVLASDDIDDDEDGIAGGVGRKCPAGQAVQMGVVNWRLRNGESAFVASNGYCGFIGDADLVFP